MSNCGCIYVDCDWYAEEYIEDQVVAKKSVRCSECGNLITRGEEHIKATYQDDEEKWRTRRTCLDCQSIIDEFFCDGHKFNAVWTNVKEHVYDLEGQISSECLLNLTPKAREKVFDIIEETWEELYALEEE